MSPSSEETMFQEALSAMQQGEKARARDLFTRLIRNNTTRAEYWLWMSAAVETNRERIYCLSEALRLEPANVTAQRGMALLGSMPPNPALAIPIEFQHRNWVSHFSAELAAPRLNINLTPKQIILGAGAMLLLLSLIIIAVVVTPSKVRLPQYGAHLTTITVVPTSATQPITSTPLPPSRPTATPSPTPPWNTLSGTYTPTPLYASTPHPRLEAYRSGIRAYEKGDWAGVVTYLQQVITAEPNSPDIYFLIAEAYRFQLKNTLASQNYDLAIKLNPRFAPAYLGRARLRMVTAPSLKEPIRLDLEKAAELDPNLAEAQIELALIALGQNNGETALKWIQKAASVLPDSPLVYHYRAVAYLLLKQPESAVIDARKALELDVTMLPAYRALGEALQASGNLPGSVAPLEIYTTYTPQDAEGLVLLGKAYAGSGENDLALRAIERAVALNNQLIDAYLVRGSIWMNSGDGKKAYDAYTLATAFNPNSFAANLGKAQALSLQTNYQEAYNLFSLTLRLATTDADKAAVYYGRALVLEILKQTPGAVADWKALLDLKGSVPAVLSEAARQHLSALATATPSPRVTVTPTP